MKRARWEQSTMVRDLWALLDENDVLIGSTWPYSPGSIVFACATRKDERSLVATRLDDRLDAVEKMLEQEGVLLVVAGRAYS